MWPQHLELPELSSFVGLKRFTLKYVKVLQNLKRKGPGRPAHLVEQDFQESSPQSYRDAAMAPPPPAPLEVDDFDLSALDDLEPQQRIEVLAVMAKQGFRFKRPQGAGGTQQPRTSPQFRFGDQAGLSAVPPPRGRGDISCANCGRKGHAASECRQPKVELANRPCFNCGKT